MFQHQNGTGSGQFFLKKVICYMTGELLKDRYKQWAKWPWEPPTGNSNDKNEPQISCSGNLETEHPPIGRGD